MWQSLLEDAGSYRKSQPPAILSQEEQDSLAFLKEVSDDPRRRLKKISKVSRKNAETALQAAAYVDCTWMKEVKEEIGLNLYPRLSSLH